MPPMTRYWTVEWDYIISLIVTSNNCSSNNAVDSNMQKQKYQ
jgi:hypothetical protein